MQVDHICGGHVYVISNFGVARNPIFCEQSDVDFLRLNVENYLSDLCEIYAYGFEHNQFQILLRVNNRNLIEEYFERKYENGENEKYRLLIEAKKKGNTTIAYPETYKIFSQEVSNLLNSHAKYFNFKYKRIGGLFAGRYKKLLVESEAEMKVWVNRLNGLVPIVSFSPDWNTEKVYEIENSAGESSSKTCYEELGKHNFRSIFSNFWPYYRKDLRGCFDSLPPVNLKKGNFHVFWLNFLITNKYFPPW